MNTEDLEKIDLTNLTSSDKWILTKLNRTIKSVRKSMDTYNFNVVGKELYKFIWEDFCDTYIEYSKVSSDNYSTKSCLILVLTDIIKMLHPFMPYVTDEIYSSLKIKDSENIILSSYPKYDKNLIFKDEEKEIDSIIEIISSVRNSKAENDIPKGFKMVNNFNDENKSLIDNNKELLTKMLKCDIISSSTDELSKVDVVFQYGTLSLYFESKKQTKEDIENLIKEKESLENSIARREKLLSNEGYVNNAPSNIVDAERQKLEEEKGKLEILISKIN